MYHPTRHADDSHLASTWRAYHRRIWPHSARAIARREVNRAVRRHGRDLCRAALDLEALADAEDFQEMLRAQDADDELEEIRECRVERVRDARRMLELALATLAADAELWSGLTASRA